MLRQLGLLADRLAQPAMDKVKTTFRRIITAAVTLAVAVALLVGGLSYLASSLWHALVPVAGAVGADLILGSTYVLVAGALFLGGFRLIK